MPNILESCSFPYGIKELSLEEKKLLAEEVRTKIIHTVAKNGGHLAPSLGTVELTLALLTVFDPLNDKVIWDVGHQTYAWKILTDRNKNFHTLRTYGGISGFSKPSESPYDHFIAGHASTSISAALGKAYARDLAKKESHVIAVIGDGALTGGMAYEALSQAGGLGKRLIVILNDNNISISTNTGALSRFISSSLSHNWVLSIKKSIRDFCYNHLKFGKSVLKLLKKSEQSFKSFFTPGSLFEAFDFNYIGPVDGHNIEQLVEHLEKAVQAQKLNQPILLHIKTIKGKGYAPAEKRPSFFHAVGSFEPETGLTAASKERDHYFSATESFSHALSVLAEKDEKILAITAAMLAGTGLSSFAKNYPERCIDVGICEQHAVTFAAGLASEGYKPIIAIYSTFLQRAYDQIIHDVCLQNLHVVFCIDRAGLVGEDGPTHHGAFDLSFLRTIPNMRILVPSHPNTLLSCLATALYTEGPIALRYPRGKSRLLLKLDEEYSIIPEGVGVFLYPEAAPEVYNTEDSTDIEDGDICILAVGSAVNHSFIATSLYYEQTKKIIPVFNARWVKPLPEKQLAQIAQKYRKLILVEENTCIGGFTSAILEYYSDNNLIQNLQIKRISLPDSFIEHGASDILREKYKLNAQSILEVLLQENHL